MKVMFGAGIVRGLVDSLMMTGRWSELSVVSVSQLSFDRRSSEARDTSGEVAWPEVVYGSLWVCSALQSSMSQFRRLGSFRASPEWTSTKGGRVR